MILFLLSQIFIIPHPTYAANGINRSFNYQARLLTSAGASVPDATYSIKFSLYDSASGGTRIYTASGTTAVPVALNVTVTNGLFSLLLGDTTFQGQNALNIDWNSDSIYIGVTVSSDAEMTPRKRLSAVPYAFNSETLQGNYASSGVATAGGMLMAIHQTSSTAATASRTALFVQTDGTSNANDFLFKGNNGTSDVFTISRQGYTTTTSIAWTSASGSSLLVSGQNVCLANGLNCPIGALVWTENATNNTVFLSTTTRDILFGGTTTSTSGFIFDFGERGTSTVIIGGTTNTNLLVGTSTYGGGLNSQFTLSGNDVLVQGQLGSIEGLFSATGVTVGTGSTVYGDGNLYKTTAGDFTLALNNTASNWRLFTSSTERLTVASSGNIGIGASLPTEALDVSGNVRNVLNTNQSFSVVTSMFVGARINSVFVSGRYMYTVSDSSVPEVFRITDVSNPANPQLTGSFAFDGTTSPNSIVVGGRYAYITLDGTQALAVFDVSNPASPRLVATTTMSGRPFDVVVSGRYAYVAIVGASSALRIVDISNPAAPVIMGSQGLGSNADPYAVFVSGRYAYTANRGSDSVSIIDVSDPSRPATVGTSTFFGVGADPRDVFVQGRYAYRVNFVGSSLSILDISNPSSPRSMGTSTELTSPRSVVVSGRYAYISEDTSGGVVTIIDVSSSTNPIKIGSVGVGSSPQGLFLSGRYLYALSPTDGTASLLDIRGLETNGLMAHSAELGSLQVLTSGQVAQDFSIGGGLTVGIGGIYSQGTLSVFASTTNATTTWFMNNASATAPVLQVTSGCDTTSSTSALLLLAGTKNDQRRFSVNCMGTVSSKGTFNTGGADFAEYFRVRDSSLEQGEVVVIDAGSTGSVERSSSSTRARTLGVIASNSGFIGNASEEKIQNPAYKVVALMGQIATKVSTQNGPISPGDELMAWENGIAVKATGAGMALGKALESLESGTGTLLVSVRPEWWAGDLLQHASGEHRVVNDLIFVSSTVASLSSSPVDSPLFTFRGSAWDASRGIAISSSFHLLNDVISPTSSFFTLTQTSGTPLLTISDIGNASFFGDLSIGKRLFLGSQRLGESSKDTYLFVDDTLAPSSTYIATNADGWQTSSTYDYAERYESDDALLPGDLVTTDLRGVNKVKRSTSPTDSILGIVSTKPGFITGGSLRGTYPIALAGRVPTRVSSRNGSIAQGDYLTASSIPGVAMKALRAGNTIGIALEPFTSREEGRISVFVKSGWHGENLTADGGKSTEPRASTKRTGLAKIYAGSRSVRVNFPSLLAYPIVHVRPYGVATKGYWVTHVSDTGFEIVVGEAPQFDLLIAWTAEATAAHALMHFSDNTTLPYDPLSGISFTHNLRTPDLTIQKASSTPATTSVML
ncbi:MAG: hypothetical protein AAB879_01300 [Patescibacteria group bacterium]